MIKDNEYTFYNPNSENDTVNLLIKIICNIAIEKCLNDAYKILPDSINNSDV